MKAVLHYRAGPRFRALLADLPPWLDVAVVPPEDTGLLARELAGADILLHVITRVTPAMLAAAPRLRLIQKIGVGVDTIDLAAARARGIAVCNMPGTNTNAVAEMTLALMLSVLRKLPQLTQGTRDGTIWADAPAIGDGLGEIGGRTVGFVGYGMVPRRLTPILQAMDARVIAHARTADPLAPVDFLPLDDLLARADIVSLHVPGGPETAGLIDAARIRTMKPGSILINTARGSLVDEAALAEALRCGQLAGAGLDVLAAEPPPPDNPLLTAPNLTLAPHLAWLTPETLARSLRLVVENARRLGTGEALLHRVG